MTLLSSWKTWRCVLSVIFTTLVQISIDQHSERQLAKRLIFAYRTVVSLRPSRASSFWSVDKTV